MLLTQANNVVIHAAAGVEAATALQQAFDEDFFERASKTYPMHPISAVSECFSRRHEASDREFDVDPGAPSAIPVLRSLNVWPGRFDLSELRYISAAGNSAQAKLQLCEDDVLVVRTGDAGRPGNAAVVPREMVGWNCLDIILMRPLALVRSEILEAALNRPSSLQRLTSLSPGTKQKHLTMTDLHRLLLPVPPRLVQDVYAQKRRAILDVVAASNTRLSKARTTRAILQNLLQ
jgi:type I restriction enzyme S subunit